MSFKFNSIALLLSSLLTGSGAWVGYELSKPKTVKGWVEWKGLTLASETNDHIWKALYFQNESELSGTTKSAEELKKTCIDLWKKPVENKNLEYVEKFCVNVLKSRKARIIAEGFDKDKFLSTDDDYKLAFIFNRYSPTFLSFLGKPNLTQDTEIASDPELLQAYKDYCTEVLKEDDTKIAVAQQLCSKRTEKTAIEWLTKEGYSLKSDEELRSEFNNYAQKGNLQNQHYVVGSTFLEAIKDKDPKKGTDSWVELTQDSNKFFSQFKKYCDEHKNQSLFEKDFLKKTYPEFKARCAKENKKVN